MNTFNIKQVKEGSKMITVNRFTHEVRVTQVDKEAIKGSIANKIAFIWNPKYKLPWVAPANRKQIRLISQYIMAYIDSPVSSPIHTSACETEDVGNDSSSNSGVISGVPKWLREDGNKVWTPCFSRTTGEFLYMRRTRYSEEGAEIARRALPICKGCDQRTRCIKPCIKISSLSDKKTRHIQVKIRA